MESFYVRDLCGWTSLLPFTEKLLHCSLSFLFFKPFFFKYFFLEVIFFKKTMVKNCIIINNNNKRSSLNNLNLQTSQDRINKKEDISVECQTPAFPTEVGGGPYGPKGSPIEQVWACLWGGSHVICDWSMASHGTPAVNRQTGTQIHTPENITLPQRR